MLTTDFSNQPYVAEVLRGSVSAIARIPAVIETLVDSAWREERVAIAPGDEITIRHSHIASRVAYHRATRSLTNAQGETVQIPRVKAIRRREHFLYDLLLLQRERHLVVAVPFHGLAARVFVDVDKALAGTRTLYETLNITNMVVRLGSSGRVPVARGEGHSTEIVVTRCHLMYSDPAERRRDLEQVRLSGSNLGASDIYAELIQPVIHARASRLVVTPVLLGLALVQDGVRKSGATTDRHGNFKVSVGPGLRQVTRLFQLLDEIEAMQDIVGTTSNIPILQSGALEGSE